LIDHVRNTQCFTLESLEILIMCVADAHLTGEYVPNPAHSDEADRILEEGFRDELTEIVSSCPHSRSTLLFSATITEDVKELARLSLDKPVRIKIDTLGASSRTLTQEFLRVRDDRPRAKEAVLVAVCRRAFRGKTIVFFRSKAAAHRVQVVFGLAGLRGAELHGDLSQEQRLQALDRFRASDVDYLLATDLASRGLDIKGVENVVNFEMPASVDVYLHRVGRTARAGSAGRALTLVGEADRKLVKLAVKHADPDSVKQRSIPVDLVKEVARELEALEDEIAAVLAEEQEEKAVRGVARYSWCDLC
jgi:ATP-dependent RNA helicase DDX27